MATKKATKKTGGRRAPTKKAVSKKASAKKAPSKRAPVPADPQVDLEESIATKKAAKGKGKKKPPSKSEVPFSGPIDLVLTEDMCAEIRKVHSRIKNDNESDTIRALLQAGLLSWRGAPPLAPASGNLIDDGEEPPYDPEFEEAFHTFVAGS